MLVLFMLKRQKGKFLGAYSCDQEHQSDDGEADGDADKKSEKIKLGGSLRFDVGAGKQLLVVEAGRFSVTFFKFSFVCFWVRSGTSCSDTTIHWIPLFAHSFTVFFSTVCNLKYQLISLLVVEF